MENIRLGKAALSSLEDGAPTVVNAHSPVQDGVLDCSVTPPLRIPARERSAVSQVTVLVAEDDDDLRQITDMSLEMMGYTVVSCRNAVLASEAFCSRADIDLLLTDLQMPRTSGVELARELTALRPSLPVMIVSGSILSAELAREVQERRWKFLSKPYGLPDLVEGLRFLLHPMHQHAA